MAIFLLKTLYNNMLYYTFILSFYLFLALCFEDSFIPVFSLKSRFFPHIPALVTTALRYRAAAVPLFPFTPPPSSLLSNLIRGSCVKTHLCGRFCTWLSRHSARGSGGCEGAGGNAGPVPKSWTGPAVNLGASLLGCPVGAGHDVAPGANCR